MTERLLELRIDDVAFGGKGVGRSEGKAVFVPFTMTGELVRAKVNREKKKFAEASLEEVLETAPGRVVPPCPYYGTCGGCSYQHVAYELQLEWKARQVEQALRRIGGVGSVPMRPPVPSPLPYGYRNRIRVHARDGKIGFYGTDGHTLVDIERCLLASDAVNAELTKLREKRVRDGDFTLRQPGGAAFFSQTNPPVAATLVEIVGAELAEGNLVLIDAYGGAGLFAKAFRNRFVRVFGIEENESAVAAAREDAGGHERYLAGPVEDHLGAVLEEIDDAPTTLLVDPPAAGLSGRVLDLIMGRMPMQLVYISCNPATLARDLAELARVARVDSVTPVDMFPQTAEIEVVVSLLRCDVADSSPA